MPCQDNYSSDSKGFYRNNPAYVYKDNPEHLKIIQDLNKQIYWLEASLCALITELGKESKIKANKILLNASKNGGIELLDFWASHNKSDETRISIALNSFSKHEQDIIKKLLS